MKILSLLEVLLCLLAVGCSHDAVEEHLPCQFKGMAIDSGEVYEVPIENDKELSWKSYDPVIANVNPDGIVEGISPGKADIVGFYRDGAEAIRCTVYVLGGKCPLKVDMRSDGNYTLTRYDGGGRKIVLPDSYKGKPIDTIGREAFRECSTVRELVLPGNLKYIEDSAFAGCESLTDINLPSGVIRLGAAVFAQCSNLESFNGSESLEVIGANCFVGCNALINVDIANCLSIGSRAFSGCSSLKSICLPDGLVSIGSYAFKDCISLEYVHIPGSVRRIDGAAFSGCEKVELHCGMDIQPEDWADDWNILNRPVIWNSL